MREESYRKLIAAIIEEERATIGDLALTKADGFDFVTVEDGGVTVDDGVGEPELVDLVDAYQAFQGDGVKGIVKRAAEKARIEKSFLPDRILPPSRDRVFWGMGAAFTGILVAIVLFSFRQHLFALHGGYVSNLIGSGFQNLRGPALLFSLGAAFVIGTAHDFIPCSVPVWTTLLPSHEDEDTSLAGFGFRSLKYFLGSAAVLASFGFILGLFGMKLAPYVKMVLQTPAVRLPVAWLLFGLIAIISLLWGFSLLGLLDLPSFQLRNTILSVSRNNKYISKDVIDGVIFGGVEVSCPFPTYHLLLLWIVLTGSPLYGALVLTSFTLGKTLPIVVVGMLMRANSSKVFHRFKLGHSVFDLWNGAMLVGAGSFLLFVFAEMAFIGPSGMSPSIVFRLLQSLLGLGIAYAAINIYRWTEPKGWRFLQWSGIVLALWSIVSLPGYSMNWLSIPGLQIMVDGVGAPVFAVLISLAATYFAAEELPIDTPGWFTTDTVSLYLFAVIALGLSSRLAGYHGIGYFSLIYGSSALLLLPAVYGFYMIQRQSGMSTWNRFFKASALLVVSIVMTLYTAAVCSDGAAVCADYVHGFMLATEIPLIEPLVTLALLAPLVMLVAVVYFAEGTFVFYHRMYEPVKKAVGIEGNRLEQLIRGTVDRVGDLIGEEMARRIVTEALEEIDDLELRFRDGEPTITLGVSIDNEQTFNEVRERLVYVFEERVGSKAAEQIRDVADEVQDLEEARDHGSDDDTETDDDESGGSGDHTCDECGKRFDSERGLHIHQGMQHDGNS